MLRMSRELRSSVSVWISNFINIPLYGWFRIKKSWFVKYSEQMPLSFNQRVFTIHTNIEISAGSKDTLSNRQVPVP